MYRFNKKLAKKIILTGLLANAHAVVINEQVFKANGGNMLNIRESLKTVNEPLRKKSFAAPFFSVGQIPACTATWLGEEDGFAYILTAAHCVPYKQEVTPISSKFTSWDGKVIADGKGTIYVPPQRINRPSGFGGASTDIAILKLPRKQTPVDDKGKPIDKPVLYDGNYELYNTVTFVGYGSWGVGLDRSGSYGPASGPRRLWGQTKVTSIFEKDHGIGAKYEPLVKTEYWAKSAPGDSGSAWWQSHNGITTIIATHNGGSNYVSTGARVSQYIDWIKSVYPNVELYSHYNSLSGYDHYEYQHIPGRNDLHLNNVSRADCAYQCSQTEWCQTFDYYNKSNQCDLSKSIADGVAIKLANHPNWDHYQVKPKALALDQFKHYQYQHIPGRNDLHLDNISREDCAYHCSQTEWCQSFDYYNKSNQCDLSKAKAGVDGVVLNNSPDYDYYELFKPVDEDHPNNY